MKKAIMGRKIGMTQIIQEDGRVLPVTVVQAEPNVVVMKREIEKDGYSAVQLGFEELKEKHTNKPKKGYFDKQGVSARRQLREFRFENVDGMNVGDAVTVEVFAAGEKVDVAGISKGKGFAGPIKRHGYGRGPMSHGSGYHRGGGALGGCSDPSRVFKGKKMAGHMGVDRVTVQNLTVVSVDVERNLIIIHGAIPGPKGGLVTVSDAVKA